MAIGPGTKSAQSRNRELKLGGPLPPPRKPPPPRPESSKEQGR